MLESQPLTWCGVPFSLDGMWADDEGKQFVSDMAILGIPYEAGASATSGQADAPYAIRRIEIFESWYDNFLGDLSTVKVVDCGDVDINRHTPGKSLIAAQQTIGNVANSTKCLVVLGGDHSVTAAVLSRIEPMTKAGIQLVHIDAHSDTWPTEDLNFFPGHESWVTWVQERNLVKHITQLGVRAMGPQIIQSSATVKQYNGTLSNAYLKTITANLKNAELPVYLSVDMDVVDPAFCPGVAYPEPGGWTSVSLLKTIEAIVATGRVIGVDIVETTPSLDHREMSVRLAHRSVLAVMRGIKRI